MVLRGPDLRSWLFEGFLLLGLFWKPLIVGLSGSSGIAPFPKMLGFLGFPFKQKPIAGAPILVDTRPRHSPRLPRLVFRRPAGVRLLEACDREKICLT